jgi:DNA-binding NarL/FixJ family response regulator
MSAPDGNAEVPAAGLIRVMIVDDDVPTRVGLRTILSSASDIEVIGEAASGDEAVASVTRLHPDVVVMDIRLPGMDGIAATREITRAGDVAPKVMVLSTFDFDEYAFQSARAGASAFVLKRAQAEELIASVRAVAQGLPVPAAGGRSVGEPTSGERLSFTPPLTPRERDVLHMVALGFTNAEIGRQLHLSIDTIKSHLKHIYAKCGVPDRARLAVAAQRSGFGAAPP